MLTLNISISDHACLYTEYVFSNLKKKSLDLTDI